MEALFDSFIEFLKNQNNYVLYSILFISGIVENLFPPAPGDTITIFGAFLIGRNRLNFFYVYLLTTAGSSIGYMILFYLGKLVQKDYFLKKDFSFFSAESFNKVELWYEKYGYVLILANRFIPAVRSVTGIVAGILRLQVFKVFIYSLISAAVWNAIWIIAGYSLGNNWNYVKKQIAFMYRSYNVIAIIIIAVMIIIYFLFKKKKLNIFKKGST